MLTYLAPLLVFGLVVFVVLNSFGAAISPGIHWTIAIVVALTMGGIIDFFSKPGRPVGDDHH